MKRKLPSSHVSIRKAPPRAHRDWNKSPPFCYFSFLSYLMPKTVQRQLKLSGRGNFISDWRNFDFKRLVWTSWYISFSSYLLPLSPKCRCICRKDMAAQNWRTQRRALGNHKAWGCGKEGGIQDKEQHAVVYELLGSPMNCCSCKVLILKAFIRLQELAYSIDHQLVPSLLNG